MKTRPILFSGAMVQALLAGRKTQTRRVAVPQQSMPKVPPLTMEPWIIDGEQEIDDDGVPCWAGTHPDYPTGEKWFSCPHGKADDRLWVREALYERAGQWFYKADDAPVLVDPAYAAACVAWAHHKETAHCPSLFMPRWASRMMREVVSVRVERLQDISEADICAELGCPVDWTGPGPEPYQRDLRGAFANLWNTINTKRGPAFTWAGNPWVWAVTFK